jgi:hypothetical protein
VPVAHAPGRLDRAADVRVGRFPLPAGGERQRRGGVRLRYEPAVGRRGGGGDRRLGVEQRLVPQAEPPLGIREVHRGEHPAVERPSAKAALGELEQVLARSDRIARPQPERAAPTRPSPSRGPRSTLSRAASARPSSARPLMP